MGAKTLGCLRDIVNLNLTVTAQIFGDVTAPLALKAFPKRAAVNCTERVQPLPQTIQATREIRT
jgi:hypothetical protein